MPEEMSILRGTFDSNVHLDVRRSEGIYETRNPRFFFLSLVDSPMPLVVAMQRESNSALGNAFSVV